MNRTLSRVSVVAVAATTLVACNADGSDAELVGDTTPAGDSEAGAPTESDTGAEPVEATAEEPVEQAAAPAETFPPNGEVVNVLSLDNSFREEITTVTAGTEVLWTNNGRNDHNVLPTDPTQDWGVEVDDFKPGDEYTLLFDTPGEYPYFCSIHGTETIGMIGTIVVTEG